MGRSRGVPQAFAVVVGGTGDDADDADDRRGRLSHANLRGRATLPGAQAAEDRHDARARARCLARHRSPAESSDRPCGLRAEVVRDVRQEIVATCARTWEMSYRTSPTLWRAWLRAEMTPLAFA